MKTLLRWFPATLQLILFVLLWSTASNGGLEGVTAWLTLIRGLPYLGGLVFLIILSIAIWKRKFTMPLLGTLLVSFLLIWPYLWQFGILAMAYPITIEETSPSISVRLPFNGPTLVAWGGDTPNVNYHITFPDARWAYDLMIEPAFIERDSLEDYGCWGVNVVAPIDGKVIIAHDGEEDVPIGEERAEGTPHQGNHVFLQLDGGTYLAIGHFQKDSITIDEGDFVEEGEILGKCGNSGSSSEPHIHIHHQKDDPRTNPDLAEGLPLIFRDHNGAPMPEGGKSAYGPIIEHLSK